MTNFISYHEEEKDTNNIIPHRLKKVFKKFSSLDPFTRWALLTIPLILVVTPFFVLNNQTYQQHATGEPVVITGIAVNNSTAKIYFQPIPGAKDYRVYDITNPSVVKYAGTKRYQASGTFGFRTMNNDGVTPTFPFIIESYTPSGGGSQLNLIHSYPQPFIEWNLLQDHQPHTLVVEAINQLGPFPLWSGYDLTTFQPLNPSATSSGSMNMMNMNVPSTLGLDEGMTTDGKWSINGQGPTTNNPTAIATSNPFVVSSNVAIKAIPSGSDATQTFFDTFDDGEGSSILLTNQNLGTQYADPAGGKTKDYSMNANTDHAWNIHYQAADINLSYPFIDGGHYMDMLFDESPGSSWAVMAMKPENADGSSKTADISNGKMLHMSMEVDSTMDTPQRRWVGFDISPANDPLTSWNTGNLNVAPINKSLQALFMEIYSASTKIKLINGSNTVTDLGQVERQQHFPNTYTGGLGLDNRSKFDFFMTQTHYLLFEDGVLHRQGDFPNGGLSFTNLQIDFSHYMYHSSAEPIEMPYCADSGVVCDEFLYNYLSESDERHWDNIGFEVLPGTDIPTNWQSLNSLMTRIQPPIPSDQVCPTNWNCSTLGADVSPLIMPSSQSVDPNGVLTVHSGAVNSSSDPDLSHFISQATNGDTTIGARVIDHANLSYWSHTGNAGVMIRQDLTDSSPFYSVSIGGDKAIHIVERDTSGGAISDNSTGTTVTLPIFLKAVRQGSSFTAFESTDGTNWTQVPNTSTSSVTMNTNEMVGVIDWELQQDPNVVYGWNPQIGTAKFDTLSINGTATSVTIPTPVQYSSTTSTPTTGISPMPTINPSPTPTPTSVPPTPTPVLSPTPTPTSVPPTPTPVLSPTPTPVAASTLGNPPIASILDSGNPNNMNGSKFTMGALGGTVLSGTVYVGAVGSPPNNLFQIGIYTDTNGAPGSLIANSGNGTLTANSWNTVSLTAALKPNTSYWLMYNTNGSNPNLNNMYYNPNGAGAYSGGVTFGTWPSSFGVATTGTWNFLIYVTYQ